MSAIVKDRAVLRTAIDASRDEPAAALREALCVSHLVHYLQGQGTFASAFHVDNDER